MLLLLLIFEVAADSEPLVKAELDRRTAFLGDAVQVSFRFDFEAGWTLRTNELPSEMGDATVLNQVWGTLKQDPHSKRMNLGLVCQVAWYELGETKLPPVEFTLTHPDGQSITLESPELTIEILPLRDEGDEALAPTKGQLDLRGILNWLLWGGLAFGLLLLGLIIWLLARRKPEIVEQSQEPLLPPFEEAEAFLRELLTSSLLKEGSTKAFYVRINWIIRRLYGRLFHVPAEEMTSFELEDFLMNRRSEIVDLNRSFQDLCDMVKFAKYNPQESENNDVVNWAHQILGELKNGEGEHVQVG